MALGKHRQDLILLIATISTVLFGIVMIYSASVIVGYHDFNDPKYFFKRQLIWAVVGIVALITTSNIDYRSWKKWATALMITTILLLLSVFLFSKGSVNGAHRWISFLGQTFQPSELAKFSFLVYICAWFTKQPRSLLNAPAGARVLPFYCATPTVIMVTMWVISTHTIIALKKKSRNGKPTVIL